jgi:hypothetical protein
VRFSADIPAAQRHRWLTAVAIICTSIWACHDQGTEPHAYPAASQPVQGDGQVGVVGTVLPQALLVLVKDRAGQPLPGVAVHFRIIAGGGTVDTTQAVTDDAGQARAIWTLGGTAGTQQVGAVVEGLSAVTFSATAKPGQPASIVFTPDSLTLDALGDSARLTVSAHDSYGNDVHGTALTWSSSDTLVATIDSSGKILSRGNGQARVIGSSGTRADTARIVVAQRGVSFAIAAGQRTINAIGDTVPLRVDWRDRNGFAAPTSAGTAPEWTLSEPTVATVSTGGLLVSAAVGQTRVVARSGAAADSTVVVVRQVLAAITLAPPGTLAAGAQQQLHATAVDSNGVTAAATTFAWQSADTAVAKIDASGQVQVRKAGTSQIAVTAPALPGGSLLSASGTLTVVAGDPAVLSIVSGDLQGATAATPLAQPLSVRVTDAYGNPTLGRPVRWSVLTGGGSVTPATDSVGADGVATAQLTVGTAPGLNTVQAAAGAVTATFTAAGASAIGASGGVLSVPGNVVAITIPAGALPGAAELTITPLSSVPSDPTLVPGTSFEFGPSMHFTTPVQVKIRFDAALIPSGTTAAQLKLHRLTNGTWQELTGNVVDLAASTVTAPSSSFSTYALLGERPVAAMHPALDTIVLTSTGATQSVTVALLDALSRILDSRPLRYVSADTTVATVSSQGVVTAVRSGTTTVTISFGILSVGVVVRVRQDAATVEVTPPTSALTALGATQQLGATAFDAGHSAVGGSTFTWTTSDAAVATVSSSGLVTAVGNGSATITAASGGVSGTAAVTVHQTAVSMAVQAGDAQSATVQNAVPIAPAVIVRDANGHPVAGVSITFAVSSGGGSVTGSPAVTGLDGVATLGSWTLGAAAGPNGLTVSAGSLSVSFTATGTRGVAAALTKSSGDAQTAAVGTAVAVAPTVHLVDALNNPVPGTVVTFSVVSGGGSVTLATPSTDASGNASVGSWTLGNLAGGDTLEAQVVGLPVVRFSATGTHGAAAQLTKVAGDAGTIIVATSRALQARVTDAFGNVIAGQSVAWAATPGAGGSVSAASSLTDASGVASITWTVDTTAGPHTATATVTGLAGSPATFTVTAVPAAASAAHSTIAASPAGIPADGASTSTITVHARDAYNNALTTSGGTVALSNAGTGTLSAVTDVGDGSYTATLTAPVAVGSASITATLGGVAIPGSAAVSFGAGALHHFTVESAAGAPIATQSASTLFAIRVTARDVNQNVVTSFTGTVNITSNRTGSAGLVTTAAFTNGVLASHQVALSQAGAGATLTATRTGGTESGTSTPFTVTPSALHHFVVEAAGGGGIGAQVARTPFAIRIVAQDADSNVVTAFTGTADVSSNRRGSAGLATTAAFAGGVLTTHSVTLTEAGSGSNIVATRTGGTESGVSAPFAVTPGALHHFKVEAAAGGSIATQAVTVPFNVRITAQDVDSNTVTAFTSTVDVSSNRTGTAGLGTSAAFTAGVLASHAVTLTQAGTLSTVVATRTGGTETGTSTGFTVSAGAVHHFVVDAVGGGGIATQTAGSPFNVQITAFDASGNVATGFTGTADVTSNRTGIAGLTTTAAFVNGVLAGHSVTLTTPTGAGATITATRTGGVETGTSTAFALNAGGLHHFLVEAAGGGALGPQTAAAPFAIRITAQDVSNNTVTSFTGTADVSSNRAGSSGLATTAAFTAGVLATHSVTLTQAGTLSTISATHTGGTESGTSATFTVSAGALHHLVVEAAGGGAIATQAVGVPFSVRITAQDASNNTVTAFSGTADITSNRTASSGMGTSAVFTAGVLASHAITLTQSGTLSTITATRTGGAETGTSAGFTVTPGAVHHFVVEAAGGGAIGTQTAGTSFNVQITAIDASGNLATGFTGTVDVTSNRTGSSGLTTSASFTAGVLATHSVTLTTPVGAGATISVTRTGGTETGTSTAFTLNAGALTHFAVEAAGGGTIATQTAAVPFNVQITALDASNNTVTSFAGTVDVTSNRTGSAGLATSAAFVNGVLTSHSVTLTQSGTLSAITAKRTGGTESGTSASFTVNAGALHHFVVDAAGGGSIATQTAGSPFNVRITAQDANNNTATSFAGTANVTSNVTGSTGLGTTAAFIAGVLTSHSITLTQPGASATITATNSAGAETGTSTAFTVNAGAATHFRVEAAGGGAIATQTAGAPFNVQITALDANENTATGFTGTVDVTSNRTGTAGLTTSAAFTAGVLASHSVTLTTPTGAGVTITATRTSGAETGTSAAFTLNAGALAHFLVEAAGGGAIAGQAAGVPFNVQVTAQDAFNNTVTAFSGTVAVSSNRTGTAGLATSAAFTAGVLASHAVTLTTPLGAGATITATRTSGTETGTSAAFTLAAGVLNHFLVEEAGGGNVATHGAGVAFNIQVTAKDVGNNTVTSFTGTVDITSNRTASAGLATSAAFTAGVLASHSVTLTAPTGAGATITATRTGGAEFGTSNSFTLGTPPTVSSTTPADNAISVSPASAIVVNFSASVNATLASFTLECPVGSSRAFTLSASPATSFTLTPSLPMPGGTTCRVTVNAAQVTDATSSAPMTANSVFSFETTPALGNDTYPQTVIGNMSVQSANVGTPYSVTANDVSANAFTITGYDATSAHGGQVTMTTSGPNMGQFVYNPPAGYHGPTDTFTYTVTTSGGSTAIGTVTMPISGMVWYVDNNAGVNGDGRLSSPFNNLQALASINDGSGNHPAANDVIFLYESSTAYVAPITLLSGQKLIGQDATAPLPAITGLTPASSSAAFPSVNPGGPVVDITSPVSGITISSGSNTLRGFRVGGNNGVGTVSGTAIGGVTGGTLTIRDVAVTTGVTGAALSLNSGTADVVLDSTFATGGTNIVSLTNVAGSVSLGASQGTLTGASGAAINVSGGTVNLTVNSPVTQSNSAALVNVAGGHSGTLTFNGAMSATSGTGLQFANADGTYNFPNVVTLNTAVTQGISVLAGSSGTISISNGASAITNPSGDAITVNASNPTFTYAGTVSKNSSGRVLNMNGLSGNSSTLSGSLSCTSSCTGIAVAGGSGGTVTFSNPTKTINTTAAVAAAVVLTSNTGTTINFTNGGLAINTTSAGGLVASGGGTVQVSGTGNHITTTAGGTGLSVQNVTSNGLLFDAISTSGGPNGIVMVSTGAGGLTVSGTTGRCDAGSTTCTGGTISGATGADGAVAGNGIYLSSAPNVSLTKMRVTGTVQNFGLYGNTVSGLTLSTMLFDGTFGTQTSEAAVGFDELQGSASITGSSITPTSGSWGDNLRITNTTATALNRLTMTSDTVGFTGNNGVNGVNILARGSNTTNLTVRNSLFKGGITKGFVFSDSAGATSDLVFSNNQVQQGAGPYGAGALAAMNIRVSGASTLTDSIASNSFTNLQNPNNAALEFNAGLSGGLGLSGNVTSYILSNTVGTINSANSGSAHNSMNLDFRGSGTHRVKVANNSMFQYGDHSFRANAWGDGQIGAGHSGGKMDLTFVSNTIAQARSGTTFTAGVQLDVGIGGNDAMTMCVNFGVGGQNNMNNSGSTDANVPFDIISNNLGNNSFLKYLSYSGSDTGPSHNAEGKLESLIGAGIIGWTNPGFEDVSQAAWITSSTDNVHGQVCNLLP